MILTLIEELRLIVLIFLTIRFFIRKSIFFAIILAIPAYNPFVFVMPKITIHTIFIFFVTLKQKLFSDLIFSISESYPVNCSSIMKWMQTVSSAVIFFWKGFVSACWRKTGTKQNVNSWSSLKFFSNFYTQMVMWFWIGKLIQNFSVYNWKGLILTPSISLVLILVIRRILCSWVRYLNWLLHDQTKLYFYQYDRYYK